jgi:hypothetical protein
MSCDWSQVHLQLQWADIYRHTAFGPVTYMGTVITKWATQCLRWVNTRSTIETTEYVINLNKRNQVSAAAPPPKTTIYRKWEASLNASLSCMF